MREGRRLRKTRTGWVAGLVDGAGGQGRVGWAVPAGKGHGDM